MSLLLGFVIGVGVYLLCGVGALKALDATMNLSDEEMRYPDGYWIALVLWPFIVAIVLLDFRRSD